MCSCFFSPGLERELETLNTVSSWGRLPALVILARNEPWGLWEMESRSSLRSRAACFFANFDPGPFESFWIHWTNNWTILALLFVSFLLALLFWRLIWVKLSPSGATRSYIKHVNNPKRRSPAAKRLLRPIFSPGILWHILSWNISWDGCAERNTLVEMKR